jgi:2,3-bisphosphoglycerate-independent phosphoglycerate mutase
VKSNPVLLTIFDGFGVNPSRAYNAWALAKTPHLDHYFASYPHTVLQASGLAVGLPDGQFGNSEVGHLTIGSGRVLEQDLVRIANAIYDDSFKDIPEWQSLLEQNNRLHILGMVSDGGVHSHIEHLIGIITLLKDLDIEPIIHFITDGRDTAQKMALTYLPALEEVFAKIGKGRVATICGRYFAMDRASHWDRTKKAWDAIVLARGLTAETAEEAILNAYERGESDEFIQPTVITGHHGISDNEATLFFNFRSDRARQLSAAFGVDAFDGFDRKNVGLRKIYCMTEYDATFPFPVFFKPQIPENVLAELISDSDMKQFHCSETEKYPHVTYFFNGGREPPYPGEDRLIVPSPQVSTYDQLPQMSAAKIADAVIDAINTDEYDFIVVNFANGDMVGHSANLSATINAVESLDLQSHRVFQRALEKGWNIILTSDHGNCDEMIDPITGEAHTQHTVYPVPLLLMGAGPVQLRIGRGLADIAPTVLDLLGLPQPPIMTGRSIIRKGGIL